MEKKKTTNITSALCASLLATTFLTACQLQSKTNVLLPTAPSSTASSSSSTASTATAAIAAVAAGTPAAAGTWASSSIAGLPNLTNCDNLQWQITSLSVTAIAGNVSAICGGLVNITSDVAGTMQGTDIVNLTANGQAVGLGITCPFSLNGVGHIQGNDAMQLDYNGMTCLGPVSGSQALHRRAAAAPPPAGSDPEPQQPDQPQAPAPDDGAFGCSGIGDHYQLVECIHGHVNPHNEYEAFEVTKRVAWALRGEGAGLLIKTTGENIVPWRGYIFAAGRICYPDGHIFKVISDVGPGGANGPSWQDNGFVDRSLYLPALDTTY